jgi:hypothetical protein
VHGFEPRCRRISNHPADRIDPFLQLLIAIVESLIHGDILVQGSEEGTPQHCVFQARPVRPTLALSGSSRSEPQGMRKAVTWIGASLLTAAVGVTAYVEAETDYRLETISATGSPKVLVLYHPSRDAGFSDEIALAAAQGFKDAGLAVDRATITGQTPSKPRGYAIVAVVSNTYWFTPDLPTLRYLARARLQGMGAIGLICGAGATGRSERKLKEALHETGAAVLTTRSFWTARPNDERQTNLSNREVARQMAREFGLDAGKALPGENNAPAPPKG